MKGEHPKVWWKEVKRISGRSSRTGDLLSKIKVDKVEGLSTLEIANASTRLSLSSQRNTDCPVHFVPFH